MTAVPGYSAPITVTVQSGDELREAEFDPVGVARFDALVTDEIEIRFPRTSRFVVSSSSFGAQVRPLALAALVPDGVDDLRPGPFAELIRSSCPVRTARSSPSGRRSDGWPTRRPLPRS